MKSLPQCMVTLPPTETVGMSIALTNSRKHNGTVIADLWRQFNRALHSIENRPDPGDAWIKYGITYATANGYRYCAGIPYTPGMTVPERMERKTLQPGHHIRFTHRGPLSGLAATYTRIYKQELPHLELAPAAEAGHIHFEKYDRQFHWSSPDSVVGIYVPV